MLQELYEYAQRNSLTARPGFRPLRPKVYVLLSASGGFIGVDPGPEREVMCPDIGSMANGPSKCNIFVEKSEILLEENRKQKREFMVSALREGAAQEPRFGLVADAIESLEILKEIEEALSDNKIKKSEKIGWKIDGLPLERGLEENDCFCRWWDDFRSGLKGGVKDATQKRCLITGALTEPVSTVPKAKGLFAVGGHSSGDALICFDKAAFCSYNLAKAENAVVSEEAFSAVNAALESLIGEAPTLAGAKWIHWYKQPVEQGSDPFADLLMDYRQKEEGGESADDTMQQNNMEEKRGEADWATRESTATDKARQLIESARNGENPERLQNEYYILSLSGAGGRVMVRNWMQGTYEELYESMKLWFDDLALCTPSGKGLCRATEAFCAEHQAVESGKRDKNWESAWEKSWRPWSNS